MKTSLDLTFEQKLELLTYEEKVQLLNWMHLLGSDDPADREEAYRQLDELRNECEAYHQTASA